MLKTTFKASKIGNLTDARYFAAWYVDYIGYNMVQGSEAALSMNEFLTIKEWVEGPESVLEIGSFPSEELIKAIILSEEIGIVEVGMFCPLEITKKLHESGKTIFMNVALSDDLDIVELKNELEKHNGKISHWVIDLNQLDDNWMSGKFFGFIKNMKEDHSVFLDGNIPTKHIDTFLTKWDGIGISAKGGEEEKVGFKSYDELDELFEALEVFE